MKIPEEARVKLFDGAIVAINKPIGPSSHGVVAFIKKITNISRVGHAGTLDPLASGVLIVGIGRTATKQLWDKKFDSKEYVTEITLGSTTTTDDAAGEKTECAGYKIPTKENVAEVLKKFVGEFEQMPPQFSALKINGKPAYKFARKGTEVELAARPVVIEELELLSYEWPIIRLRITCRSGVYVRSLARDIGAELGTGAYMSALVRTRVGEHTIDSAIPVSYVIYDNS